MALSLSLRLRELTTNAMKWGASSNDGGPAELLSDIERAGDEARFNLAPVADRARLDKPVVPVAQGELLLWINAVFEVEDAPISLC